MCGLTFRDIVTQRYAVQKFDGRTIPEEKMEELYEMIRYTPSGLNFQPWKIKIIRDATTKQKLRPASWDQEQITTCSHLLVFCANLHMKEQMERVAQVMKDAGIPQDAIDQFTHFAKDFLVHVATDKLKVWAQHNVFLALATALYGAASLGIDACPMGGFDPDAYAKILDLPPHLVPTMLCTLGYAADAPGPKVRLPREEIFF
jgi:nitroreductase/dihydropteridine reductase